MNPMIRFDYAIARAMAPWFKNAKVADFMPWPREEELEATPEAVLALLNFSKVNK